MTNIIPYLASQGVSQEVLAYILLTPLIATFIAFLRQVIGLKSIGVYHPLLLAFAFVGAGLKEGLIFFLLIAVLANAITYLVKKFSLLYLPRLTIVVTVTTLALILTISVIRFSDYSLMLQSYLPIVIILALSDKLVTVQIKKNLRPAVFLIASTIVIALLSYLILNVSWLQQVALSYPIIFLLSLLVFNVFLGRFKGLRLDEVWRFRHLLKLPQKDND
jgi:hypothetical protein